MNTHNSWPLCSGESYPESDLKRPVLTLEKTKCLSVCYRSKNQLSPEPAAHLLLGQHHCSGTSGKDSFPPCFCLCHPADETSLAPPRRAPLRPLLLIATCHVSLPEHLMGGHSSLAGGSLGVFYRKWRTALWEDGKCKLSPQTAAQWSICSK